MRTFLALWLCAALAMLSASPLRAASPAPSSAAPSSSSSPSKSPSPSASAWTEFRGTRRNGVARAGTIPLHFGPDTNVVWRISVPGGHSSPVVAGERLFLTGSASNQLLTLAVDRHTGAPLWSRAVEPGRVEAGSRLSHPATSTPALDGGRLIVYFAPFGLIAYSHAGEELWRHPLPTPVTQHGASSSPTLAGGTVIQLCDQDFDSYLLALDAETGAARWRVERPQARRGFSTPLAWPPDHPELVVVAGTLQLTAYDLRTGAVRWSVPGLPNEMVASPIGTSDRIFVAGWTSGSGVGRMPAWEGLLTAGDADHDGELTRDEAPNGPAKQHFAYIDADKNGRLTRSEYEALAAIFDHSQNVAMALDPTRPGPDHAPAVLWRQTRGLPYVPTPLWHDGRVYLVRNGGLASCLDAATGEYRFQEERLGALGDYYSSPIAAGDRVLMISQPGVAVVLRAGEALEILARNALGEEVLATPALVEETLYVRTKSALYAFRERGPSVP